MPTPPDPRTALLWFAGFLAIALLGLWPRRGFVWRLAQLGRVRKRVLVEDALKYLVNAEQAKEPATVTTLAGALEISRERAHALVTRLTEQGFATATDHGLEPTDSGRAYGMRVLRSHRLLERFFADRTSLDPATWHGRADSKEHRLSPADADRLAFQMGDPLVDPHGDPIPTSTGRLPSTHGLALGALEPGETGVIVHIEDEPEQVYRRLVGLGFHPAMPVKITAKRTNELELLIGGRAVSVDALAAAAVTVDRVPEQMGHTVLFERLDELKPGETAEVVQIAPSLQGSQRRRLLDLGVLPGTSITAEIRSPSGDPVAYRIRGALIGLRRPQAQSIYIRRPGPEQREAFA